METGLEARIYAAREMQAPELFELATSGVSVYTVPSPVPGRVNEDCAAMIRLDERRCVLVVADGMGGCPGGDLASQIAVERLSAEIEKGEREGIELRESILGGFDRGNRAILDMNAGAGTTVIAAEVEDNKIRTYHCGDSRALITGGRGKIKLETVDHSPVGYAVESGILSPEDAMHHYARHLVSNYMGTPDMKVEMSPVISMRPRDTLVLASDGLFDNLLVGEVADFVRRGGLEAATEEVVRAARSRMDVGPSGGVPSKPDDLTLILFRPRRDR
jgi:serine/threonine protein phosphatase PrpC